MYHRFLFIISLFSLMVASSCTQVNKQNPSEVQDTPVEEDGGQLESNQSEPDVPANVDSMTMEEKLAAIDKMVRENPPIEMSDEQRTQEQQMVQDMTIGENPASLVMSGNFVAGVHEAFGSFKIMDNQGKKVLVMSDDFNVDTGPNLHVFLSGSENPATSQKLHEVGASDLGKLKSIAGTQTYEIPQDVEFEVKSVVIYCVPFKVVFAYGNVAL